MGPDWKTCSQCSLLIPPSADGSEVRKCPGCGHTLKAVAPEAMESQWFYEENRRKFGPLTSRQLAALLASKKILPTTLIRKTTETKWQRLRNVAELSARPAPAAEPEQPGTFVARHKLRPYELIVSLAAIVVITIIYWLLSRSGAPRPGGLIGHSLGIVGFLLMLAAEILYSIRKRSRRQIPGRSATWLRVHIVMGIVGPYLVLLHSAGRFQGLAGLVMFMTVLVVLSGFVGRYMYTAVPRTHDGAELTLQTFELELRRDSQLLEELGLDRLPPALIAEASATPPRGWQLFFSRPWLALLQRRRLRSKLQTVNDLSEEQAEKLENVLMDRFQLLIIVHSLPVTRRVMAIWHMVHVPMGVAMFALAFLHIIGALYYSTFLR